MIINNKDQKKPLSHYLFKAEATKRVFDTLEKGVSLLNSYFIISSISVFSFGLYQLILSLVSIVRGLGLNFFDGLVAIEMRRYFNVQKPDFAKKIFKENIVFKIIAGCIMAIAVFFGSQVIADLYSQDVSNLIKWASILLITGAFQSLTAIFVQSIVSFSQQGLSALREFFKLGMIAYFFFFSHLTISEVVIAHVAAEVFATVAFSIFIFIKKYKVAFRGIVETTEPLMWPLVKARGADIFVVFGLKEVIQDAAPWLVKIFINTEGVALYSLAVNLTAFIQDFMPMAGVKPIFALKADNLPEMAFIFVRSVKYTFWFGVLLFAASFIAVPFLLAIFFPKYVPAIPVFLAMAAVLPIHGSVKIIQLVLAALREYKILARRLVGEVLVLFIGSAIFLPTIGVVGIGLVYLARYLERTLYLYGKLVKIHPEFKIKFRNLFIFDKTDKQFIKSFFPLFFRNKRDITKDK